MTDSINEFKEWRRLKAGYTIQTSMWMLKAFYNNVLINLVVLNTLYYKSWAVFVCLLSKVPVSMR